MYIFWLHCLLCYTNRAKNIIFWIKTYKIGLFFMIIFVDFTLWLARCQIGTDSSSSFLVQSLNSLLTLSSILFFLLSHSFPILLDGTWGKKRKQTHKRSMNILNANANLLNIPDVKVTRRFIPQLWHRRHRGASDLALVLCQRVRREHYLFNVRGSGACHSRLLVPQWGIRATE